MAKEDPISRLTLFKKRRKKIFQEIQEANIILDYHITADSYRIIRKPNTLHGETGLVAKPVENINRFKLKDAMVCMHADGWLSP